MFDAFPWGHEREVIAKGIEAVLAAEGQEPLMNSFGRARRYNRLGLGRSAFHLEQNRRL